MAEIEHLLQRSRRRNRSSGSRSLSSISSSLSSSQQTTEWPQTDSTKLFAGNPTRWRFWNELDFQSVFKATFVVRPFSVVCSASPAVRPDFPPTLTPPSPVWRLSNEFEILYFIETIARGNFRRLQPVVNDFECDMWASTHPASTWTTRLVEYVEAGDSELRFLIRAYLFVCIVKRARFFFEVSNLFRRIIPKACTF